METKFYKQRKNRLVAGVIAGLADKYGWDLALARVLAALLIYLRNWFWSFALYFVGHLLTLQGRLA